MSFFLVEKVELGGFICLLTHDAWDYVRWATLSGSWGVVVGDEPWVHLAPLGVPTVIKR